MSSLQLTVALLCLFSLLSLTCAALDLHTKVKILRDVDVLREEKQDIAKRYHSSLDFSSNVLDRGLELLEQMHELVHKYGIEEEFPSVAAFVEELKSFVEDTKVYTEQQRDKMEKEFDEKSQTKALLMTLLD